MESDSDRSRREEEEVRHRQRLENVAERQTQLLEMMRESAEEQKRIVKRQLKKEQAEKDAQDAKRKDIAAKQGREHLLRSLQLDPRLIENLKSYCEKNLDCDIAAQWAGQTLADKFSDSAPILEIDAGQFEKIFKIKMSNKPACRDFALGRVVNEAPEYLSYLLTRGDIIAVGTVNKMVRRLSGSERKLLEFRLFNCRPLGKSAWGIMYDFNSYADEMIGMSILVDEPRTVYEVTKQQFLSKKFVCLGWGASKMRICEMRHLAVCLKMAEDKIWEEINRRKITRQRDEVLGVVFLVGGIGAVGVAASVNYTGNMNIMLFAAGLTLIVISLAFISQKDIAPMGEFFSILEKKYGAGTTKHD